MIDTDINESLVAEPPDTPDADESAVVSRLFRDEAVSSPGEGTELDAAWRAVRAPDPSGTGDEPAVDPAAAEPGVWRPSQAEWEAMQAELYRLVAEAEQAAGYDAAPELDPFDPEYPEQLEGRILEGLAPVLEPLVAAKQQADQEHARAVADRIIAEETEDGVELDRDLVWDLAVAEFERLSAEAPDIPPEAAGQLAVRQAVDRVRAATAPKSPSPRRSPAKRKPLPPAETEYEAVQRAFGLTPESA